MFQFTPLREGRLRFYFVFSLKSKCFNSRPCVRGDIATLTSAYLLGVSIHAPA